jgi:hypothetical protein
MVAEHFPWNHETLTPCIRFGLLPVIDRLSRGLILTRDFDFMMSSTYLNRFSYTFLGKNIKY